MGHGGIKISVFLCRFQKYRHIPVAKCTVPKKGIPETPSFLSFHGQFLSGEQRFFWHNWIAKFQMHFKEKHFMTIVIFKNKFLFGTTY
jgi:hypothetical protein